VAAGVRYSAGIGSATGVAARDDPPGRRKSGGGSSYLMIPGMVRRRRGRRDTNVDEGEVNEDEGGGGRSRRCGAGGSGGCGTGAGSAAVVQAVATSCADGLRLMMTRSGQSKWRRILMLGRAVSPAPRPPCSSSDIISESPGFSTSPPLWSADVGVSLGLLC